MRIIIFLIGALAITTTPLSEAMSGRVEAPPMMDDTTQSNVRESVNRGEKGIEGALEYITSNNVNHLFYRFPPHVNTSFKQTILHVALERGKYDIAQRLLQEYGANPNIYDSNDQTPFHMAVQRQQHDTVRTMLSQDITYPALTDRKNYLGLTTLHIAIEQEDIEMIQILLDADAQVDTRLTPQMGIPGSSAIRIASGGNALHLAAAKGSSQIMELLLEKHKPNLMLSGKNLTPIQIAANEDASKIIELLIKEGYDPSHTYPGTKPALYVACEEGHAETAKAILAPRQVNPNQRYQKRSNETALHAAARANHIACVRVLLAQEGIKVNALDNRKETPLHGTAVKSPAIVHELLQAGADPNHQNKEGETPLHSALFHMEAESTRLLISYGADIATQNRKGYTPLAALLRDLAKWQAPESMPAKAFDRISQSLTKLCRMLFHEYPVIFIDHEAHRLLFGPDTHIVRYIEKQDEVLADQIEMYSSLMLLAYDINALHEAIHEEG